MISVGYNKLRFLSTWLVVLFLMPIFPSHVYAQKQLPKRIPFEKDGIQGNLLIQKGFQIRDIYGWLYDDGLKPIEKRKIDQVLRKCLDYPEVYVRIVSIFRSEDIEKNRTDRTPLMVGTFVHEYLDSEIQSPNFHLLKPIGVYDGTLKRQTNLKIGFYKFVYRSKEETVSIAPKVKPELKKETTSVVSKIQPEPEKKKVYVKPRSRSEIYRKDLDKIRSKFFDESQRVKRRNYDEIVEYVATTLKEIPTDQKIFVEVYGFADKVGFNGAKSNQNAALRRAKKARDELFEADLLKNVEVKEFAYNAKDIIHNDRGVEVIFYRGTNSHESNRIVKVISPEPKPTKQAEVRTKSNVIPKDKKKQPAKTISSKNSIVSGGNNLIETLKEKLKNKNVRFICIVIVGPCLVFLIIVFIAVVFKQRKAAFRISSRVVVVGGLVCVAGGLFYLQYESNKKKASLSKVEPTEWEFKIKGRNNLNRFTIEAGVPYSFLHSEGFSQINIKEQLGKSRQATLSNYKVRGFHVLFDKPMKMDIICKHKKGVFTDITTYMTVYKGRRSGSRLYYLSTDKWFDLNIRSKRGYRVNWPKFQESLIFGKFENGKLVEQAIFSNKAQYHSWFWNSNQDLKIKAGEVPFLALGLNKIKAFPENLIINAGRYTYKKAPCFLDRGQIYKTGIYLDKEDGFNVIGAVGYTGYVNWKNWKGMKKHFTFYKNSNNKLEIRADKDCIISEISINRKKRWTLKLDSGQEKRLKFSQGDKIEYQSRSRYYVNGGLKEPKTKYTRDITKDGYVTFKASVDPREIYVRTLKRKGY